MLFRSVNRNLRVTVPAGWDQVRSTAEWQPPAASAEEDPQPQSALSVGTSTTWTTDGEGVFVGLLPGTTLPDVLPQHPECAQALGASNAQVDSRASVTGVFTGCPGGVTVERVVQVASNLLLWVQVRSAERGTATDVLASVRTSGL